MSEIQREIADLRRQLAYHSRKYYVEDAPEISDASYDRMFRRLVDLETQYPEFDDPNSPTKRVGGAALDRFDKVIHTVPMGSLQDVFDAAELCAFLERTNEWFAEAGLSPHYSVECKIDGLSVSLEYRNGLFVRGSTRGDGITGEDVTENLKTIHSLPLSLQIPDPPAFLEVRGEVYMAHEAFAALNRRREENEETLFANPRNARPDRCASSIPASPQNGGLISLCSTFRQRRASVLFRTVKASTFWNLRGFQRSLSADASPTRKKFSHTLKKLGKNEGHYPMTSTAPSSRWTCFRLAKPLEKPQAHRNGR